MCPILSYQNIATLTPVYGYSKKVPKINIPGKSKKLSWKEILLNFRYFFVVSPLKKFSSYLFFLSKNRSPISF